MILANFSRARTYAGVLTMENGTVAIGNLPLNGFFNCCAVSDVRHVLQAPSGTEGKCITQLQALASGFTDITIPEPTSVPTTVLLPPFASELMSQVCTSEKDYVLRSPITDGIAAVIGADITTDFNSVDATGFDTLSGEWTQYPMQFTYLHGQPQPMATNGLNIAYIWVSPWNIGIYDGGDFYNNTNPSAFPVANQVINHGAIHPLSALDFRVKYQVDSTATNGPAGYSEQYGMRISHVYGNANGDGSVYYQNVVENYNFSIYSGERNAVDYEFDVSTSAKAYMGGLTEDPNVSTSSYVTGQYIGTGIAITMVNSSVVNGDPTQMTAIPVLGCMILVRERNTYQQGALQARVLQYEGIGIGQGIRLRGLVLAECIPGPATAPFVRQHNDEFPPRETNLNVMPLAALLYNSNNALFFRRAYTLSEYEKCRVMLKTFYASTLRSLGSPEIIKSAQDANILSPGFEEHTEKVNPAAALRAAESQLKKQKTDHVSHFEISRVNKRLKDMDGGLVHPANNIPKFGQTF